MDYRVGDVARIGGAVGYGANEGDVDGGRGEVDGTTLMAYGSVGGLVRFHGDAVLGYTWLDYDNERNINVGTFRDRLDSGTDGDEQKSAIARAGWGFEMGPVVLGPSVRYQYQDLDVDGYAENGDSVLGMAVDDMTFESRILWLGGGVAVPMQRADAFLQPTAHIHWGIRGRCQPAVRHAARRAGQRIPAGRGRSGSRPGRRRQPDDGLGEVRRDLRQRRLRGSLGGPVRGDAFLTRAPFRKQHDESALRGRFLVVARKSGAVAVAKLPCGRHREWADSRGRPAEPSGPREIDMRTLLRMLPIALIGFGLSAWADERADARDFDRAVAALEPAPLPSEAETLTRIAFASCLDQDRPLGILDRLRAEDPDLLLLLGDNVYGDSQDRNLVPLRAAYARLARAEPFRELRATLPILATWDDHDYGRNDAGADFEGRAASEALFETFWAVDPARASTQRAGVHDAFVFGPAGRRVQILLLDTRSFRSPLTPSDERGAPGRERYVPEPDPARTMLGAAQWDWLRARLREPADLRLLVSSIQVLADGHGWEAWRTLPRERERLLGLLATADGDSVILSGDRHRAGLYRREIGGTALLEATSSSLNRPIPGMDEEAGPLRLGPTYTGANYGLLEVDWETGSVRLEIRAADGETVLAQALPLDR